MHKIVSNTFFNLGVRRVFCGANVMKTLVREMNKNLKFSRDQSLHILYRPHHARHHPGLHV